MNAPAATLVLLALPAALSTDEAPLRFAPEPGAVATKTFERSMEISGGELTVVMDGQEVPPEYLPDLAVDVTHEGHVTVRDRYLRSADGRPLELERTFERIESEHEESSEMLMEGMDTSSESAGSGTSALEGETLRYHWDAGDEAYEVSFHEREDGDASLLEGLVEDTDLRAWLPAEAVDTGASWSVPADAFAAVWSPGGDLAVEFDGDATGLVATSTEYAGELELTLAGIFGDDGERVAVIEVGGEVTVTTVSPTNLDDIPVVDGTGIQTNVYVHTLAGELRWSLSAGRLAGLELEAELETDATIEADADAPVAFASTVKMDGTATYRITVE